ncbi:MAG TPA: hypothetical protein DD708_00705 [Deltaproteobacteria bacterium]|nr:hypothetical protein [Deltaproteobacteria bacterium]
MKTMGSYKDKTNEPVEQITVEEDILVISVSGKIFDVVGDIENIDLPEEGSEIEAGDILATVVGSEEELELKAPVSGTILEVNDLFSEEITKTKNNPQSYEWLVRMEPQDPEDLVKFED